MKFLHTSDWHIGRQFHNVSLLDDQAHVLDQVVRIAVDEQVDAVLIAGDIYDRSVPPAAAVSLLDKTLNRLCKTHQIPVILIAGNHDSPERLGFGAEQMQMAGLHVFGPLEGSFSPVVLADKHGDVAFYGIPYAEPAVVRERYQADVTSHDETLAFLVNEIASDNLLQQRRTVVLSHCFIDGGAESESERPLSVGGADRVSPEHFQAFNYAALGHLHGPQYKLAEHIRYSGSLLKYSFSETNQTKSVTLVDMDANGDCEIEKIPLKARRDLRVIEGEFATILQQGATDPNADDYLLVRLTDTHAIMDIMGKLREVYPNVLHIERPGLIASPGDQKSNRERLKKGEMSLFKDFYQQIQGEPLSIEQQDLLSTLLDELRQEEA